MRTISTDKSPIICTSIPGGTSSVLSCTKSDNLGNCSIYGDLNMDVEYFLLNKRTMQEYWEGDQVISGCLREWRSHDVRKGLEEWIKIMSSDEDPFWMMNASNNHDLPLGKEHLPPLPSKGYFKLGLVYKNNRLQFRSPGQKDETTVYFDNELQRILERCPFEGVIYPKSSPDSSGLPSAFHVQAPLLASLHGWKDLGWNHPGTSKDIWETYL